MLADPTKLRSIAMNIRFTERERAVIDWAAEQAGISPSLFAYQCLREGLAQRMAVLDDSEAQQGRAA